MTGSLLAGFVDDTTHPSASGTWQAATVLTALAALAAGTGAALVAAVAVAVVRASLTAGQPATSQAYGNVLSALAVLLVVTTWLWARAAGAVAKHLELELRIRATETLLGAVISIGVLTMVPVEIVWFGVIRSSAFWLTAGLMLLAASACTTPGTLRRAGAGPGGSAPRPFGDDEHGIRRSRPRPGAVRPAAGFCRAWPAASPGRRRRP